MKYVSKDNLKQTVKAIKSYINKVYENYSSNYYKTILISNIKDKFKTKKNMQNPEYVKYITQSIYNQDEKVIKKSINDSIIINI